MIAKLGRLLHKALLAFLDEVEPAAGPKSPRVTGRDFPAERDAPEHRQRFHAEISGKIDQLQQILLVKLLDLVRRRLGDFTMNEWITALRAGPDRRVHPEWAVR